MQVALLPPRLPLALAASACMHAAVLANVPLAPGLGDAALLAARTSLTARIESTQNPLEDRELPPPPWRDAGTAAPAPAELAQAAALPSAEIYFRGGEVDERANALNEVNLIYPEKALAANESGSVTLRLKIDHLGVLRDAAVLESQPAGVFEDAALQAVRELKFRPAVRNGVPVGSVKTIEVPFHPDCTRTGSCIAGAG